MCQRPKRSLRLCGGVNSRSPALRTNVIHRNPSVARQRSGMFRIMIEVRSDSPPPCAGFLPHRGGGVERSAAERDGGGSRLALRYSPLRLALLGTSPTMGEENKIRHLNAC